MCKLLALGMWHLVKMRREYVTGSWEKRALFK